MTLPPSRLRASLSPWLAAAALLACAAGAGWLLDARVTLVSQSMFFVLAVVVAAWRFDWRVSIAATVAGVTLLNFLFVPPRWTLAVDDGDHLLALLLMLVVALATRYLAASLRRETQAARSSERRARQLQQLAVALGDAASAQEVQRTGMQALKEAFPGTVTLVLGAQPDAIAAGDAAIRDGLVRCMQDGAVLGPGTGRWPGLDAWFVPLMEAGTALGAMRIASAVAADDEGREHAGAIAALLAQALRRLALQASARQAWEQARRQQMQTTFLAGVAHDLRTPLTAIIGTASTLQAHAHRLPADVQAGMLQTIVDEARHLVRLADNTLQLTRLQSPDAALPRNWESLEEIVGATLARVRPHDPQRRIHAAVAPGLPLVMADPMLLSQLLFNLLDNALRYSRGGITLGVGAEGGRLRLAVDDEGPPIAADDAERIFRPHERGDSSGGQGAGLGLAVGRAIAQAHDAQLLLQAAPGGGNRFSLLLPVQDAAPSLPAVDADAGAQP